MGYTHYWKTKKRPTSKQWAQIQAAVEKLFALKEVKPLIRYESDKYSPPIVNAEFIRFNGRGEKGHETFYFSRDKTDFEFCKTEGKPYDIAVTACLCLAEHFAPDCYTVKSDGYKHEWLEGQILASRVTGERVEVPKEVEEEACIL
jgi:hypothetical protein